MIVKVISAAIGLISLFICAVNLSKLHSGSSYSCTMTSGDNATQYSAYTCTVNDIMNKNNCIIKLENHTDEALQNALAQADFISNSSLYNINTSSEIEEAQNMNAFATKVLNDGVLSENSRKELFDSFMPTMRFVGTEIPDDPTNGDIVYDLPQGLKVWDGSCWIDIGSIEPSERTPQEYVMVTHCPNCGAPVNRRKKSCPYCDVVYPIEFI